MMDFASINKWKTSTNAMTTYINSKKPKCQHERTFYWQGWRACVECGLCIHKVFSQNPYSNVAGYITKPKEDSFPKIRKTVIDSDKPLFTRKKVWLSYSRYGWDEPLKNGLPLELIDHLKELCLKCMDLEEKVKCHMRSLSRCDIMGESKIFISRNDNANQIFEKSWRVRANDLKN